jgi:hypothetical protein
MRIIAKIVLAALVAIQAGCAAGARVGGPRTGVGVGAAVAVPPPPPSGESRYPVPPPPLPQ